MFERAQTTATFSSRQPEIYDYDDFTCSARLREIFPPTFLLHERRKTIFHVARARESSSLDGHREFRFSPQTCYSGETRLRKIFTSPTSSCRYRERANKIHETQLAETSSRREILYYYSRAGNRLGLSSRWSRPGGNGFLEIEWKSTNPSSTLGAAREHAKLVNHLSPPRHVVVVDLAARHWG